MRKFFFLLLLCLFASAPGPVRAQDDVTPGFEARTYRDAGGKTLLYRLFIPKGYDAAKRYPLVVALHGAGERGDDNKAQIRFASRLPWATPASQEKNPCFILAPQCPANDKWINVDRWDTPVYRQPEQPTEPLRLVMELIPALQKEFSIDAGRIYASGLSMGGYGTWELINRRPDLFAAAAPVCGGADETFAERVKQVPLWVFHGGKDTVVLPVQSRRMVEAVRKAGGTVKYTEYPEAGHNSWDPAYAEPSFLDWFFAQRKP